MTTLDLPLALVLAFSWVAMPTLLLAEAIYCALEQTSPRRFVTACWPDQSCALQNPCCGLAYLFEEGRA